MKKILLIMTLALVIVWGVGIQKAAAGSYSMDMDEISFYAVDTSANAVVTLTVSQLAGSDTLQYKAGSANWADAGGSIVISPVTTGGMEQVYLRLVNGTTVTSTAGNITFWGKDDANYNSITVNWTVAGGTLALDLLVPDDKDNVAPVPIPAAVWLLGSGLLGLVGIRRRSTKA